ncbi:MAG: hypothetical protein K2N54_05515 [Helicobacter sp.]|nr:hypothetical protein [Helicobacter sp.]
MLSLLEVNSKSSLKLRDNAAFRVFSRCSPPRGAKYFLRIPKLCLSSLRAFAAILALSLREALASWQSNVHERSFGIPCLLIATLAPLARNDNGIFCDSVYFFGGATLVALIKL